MSRRAFTLTELLVVVAAVTLLLALVLPLISQVQSRARHVECRSNLRQVFEAQSTYAVDHGRFAALWSEDDPQSWRVRLEQAVPGTMEAMYCPEAEDVQEFRPEDMDVAGVPLRTPTYGVNGVMQFPRWDFQPLRVPRPGRIIAIAEQPAALLETAVTSDGFGVWGAHGMANWYQAPAHSAASAYRHQGQQGANVAMMDGAVTSLNHGELQRESGHWYWFNALVDDTAFPPGDGGEDRPQAEMDDDFSPNPRPDFDPEPNITPAGPLIAPCGCPIDP